jgi:hypothetical protein
VPRAFDEVKRQVWAAIFWQKGARRLLQRYAIERQHGELATRRRAAAAKTTDADRATLKEQLTCSRDTHRLRRSLDWDDAKVAAYLSLQVSIGETVGLAPVKTYLKQLIDDAVGRRAVKEAVSMRHVVLSGEFGTGKRTAAKLIAETLAVLRPVGAPAGGKAGAAYGAATVDGPVVNLQELLCNPSMWRAQIEDDGKAVTELDPPIRKNTVFYWRLQPASGKYDASKRFVDTAVFQHILKMGSVVIVGGTPAEVEGIDQMDCLRRQEPRHVKLGTLSAASLAHITLQLALREGYMLSNKAGERTHYDDALSRTLSRTLSPSSGLPELHAMQEIVRQKYDSTVIKQRNAWLASEMLDLAKGRKNERVLAAGACVDRMTLTPEDFGCEMLSKDELLRMQAEVDAAVAAMVGWGSASLDDRGSPKHFFAEMKARMEQATREGAVAASALSHIVVTGDTVRPARAARPARGLGRAPRAAAQGTGKTQFANLVARFARAYRMLSKGVVVEKNGVDLARGGRGGGGAMVEQVFRDAQGGCVLIDEAHNLGASAGVGAKSQDAGKREVVEKLLTESENNRDSTLVILAGYKEKMDAFLRTNPGLQSRFARRVHIQNFSPAEIVDIAERVAAANARSFEPGLKPKLVQHVQDRFGDSPDEGNGRLARRLVLDVAEGRRSERLALLWKDADPLQPAAARVDEAVYIATDFGIGDRLGENAEVQQRIDDAIENMVGIRHIKEWFSDLRQQVDFVQVSPPARRAPPAPTPALPAPTPAPPRRKRATSRG